ncbi:uracil-DNA glycosylase [Thiovibrio sp. JS02]
MTNETRQATRPEQPLSALGAQELLFGVRKVLRFHHCLGIEEYPASPELRIFLQAQGKAAPAKAQAPKPAPPVARTKATAPQPPRAATLPASLAGLAEEVASCRRCPRHKSRGQGICPPGPREGKLLIVGDSPSAEDDRLGIPFSGEAGALLDKMLAAIGMGRENVRLTFLVKCHGPEPPDAAAGEACLPFLLREIAAFRPRVICAMGPLASQKLLHSPKPLSHLRGRFHDLKGTPLMPTFSPDFLLKNPELKKAAWLDLQLIQKLCDGK